MAKTTATGAALNDIALRLMSKDRTLSLTDARTQATAQEQRKAEFMKKQGKLREKLEYGIGGKAKHTILTKLLGNTIGGGISNLIRSKSTDENIARNIATNNENRPEGMGMPSEGDSKWARLPSDDLDSKKYKKIIERLNSIEGKLNKVLSAKMIKSTESITPTSPHHEEASQGLLVLGYKKKEVDEMLKNASGSSAADIILKALKSKNTTPIPASDVPTVASNIKAEVQKDPEHKSPFAEQEEAAEVVKEEKETDGKKSEKGHKKKVIKKLDEILDKLKNVGGGGSSMLGGGIMAVIGRLLGPIWDAIKKVGLGIAAVAEWFAAIGVTGLLAALAAVGLSAATLGGLEALNNHEWKKTRTDVDEKLASHGIKRLDNKGAVTTAWEINGERVEKADLTPEQEDVINTAVPDNMNRDKKSQDTLKKIKEHPEKYDFRSESEKLAPAPAPAIVSPAARISEASSENRQLVTQESAPIINQVVKNDNRTINQPQTQKSSGDSFLINTRNPEPSAGGYVAQIFNHPVARIPM